MSLSATLIVIVVCLVIAVAGALDTVKTREQRNSQQGEERP